MRQAGNDVGKRAVARRIVGRGAGKQFVPGAEGGLRALDVQRERRRARGLQSYAPRPPTSGRADWARAEMATLEFGRRLVEPGQHGADNVLFVVLRPLAGLFEQAPAFDNFDVDIGARLVLDVEIAAKARVLVDPRLDRELVAPDAIRAKWPLASDRCRGSASARGAIRIRRRRATTAWQRSARARRKTRRLRQSRTRR